MLGAQSRLGVNREGCLEEAPSKLRQQGLEELSRWGGGGGKGTPGTSGKSGSCPGVDGSWCGQSAESWRCVQGKEFGLCPKGRGHLPKPGLVLHAADVMLPPKPAASRGLRPGLRGPETGHEQMYWGWGSK